MKTSKTVRIFLLDGDPTGSKIAELSNWTGLCYIIPRKRLASTLKDPDNQTDLTKPCAYLLLGENDEGEDLVYVGEAENFTDRIKYHVRDRDFWNTAILFTSTDNNLTKGHIKFIESKLIDQIRLAERRKLDNAKESNLSPLPRSEVATITEFFENIRIVLSTLGYTLLERIDESSVSKQETYHCKGPDAKGVGVMTDEGFFVLEDSIMRGIEVESAGVWLKQLRAKLIQSDSLAKDADGNYRFTKAVKFGSPSTAAGVVLGRRANGWKEWKNEDNKTIDELLR